MAAAEYGIKLAEGRSGRYDQVMGNIKAHKPYCT